MLPSQSPSIVALICELGHPSRSTIKAFSGGPTSIEHVWSCSCGALESTVDGSCVWRPCGRHVHAARLTYAEALTR